ncbi:MAG: methyl-accepting chemotaxis protein [Alphaproteobacteria bacterium]|nr:MAG: methyl-accepting chemotaxis protein [Caulobacteraceae bacterium]TPW04009.1 MAG: methyl-accepting chemotaxis protein [Alphaproteobacteria bacterium]
MKVSARVSAISILPILGLVGFAGVSVSENWRTMTAADQLYQGVDLAVVVGDAVHLLQAERGMSTAFVNSGGANGEALNAQRARVDQALDRLNALLAEQALVDADVTGASAQFIEAIDDLSAVRTQVNERADAAAVLAGRITTIIGAGMRVIALVTRDAGSVDVEAGRALGAYAAIGRAKEQAGRERVTGQTILAAPSVAADALMREATLVGAQEAELAGVEGMLLPQHVDGWTQLRASPEYQRVEEMRREVFSAAGQAPPFAPSAWFDAATARIDALRAYQVIIAEDAQATAVDVRSSAQWGLSLAAIIALLTTMAAVIAARVVGRSITKPLSTLTSTMSALASGDRNAAVDAAERSDEIGEMGKAVLVFKNAAIALDEASAEKVRLEAQAAAERARNEAERAAKSAEQERVVGGLADGLRRLSDGDLTMRLNAAFAPEYEQLRNDFNGAVDKLQGALRVVISNAGGIRSGAGEISQAADDLSKRTEQQAASLEETAAALDQITATVRKTAAGAGQANAAVSGARADAEASGKVVRDAVSAMSEIERSSDQIARIIGVIDEIAFQTNLLALNAGVEAARAGEAGRGFAVVASEVRALAQRSASAAKEIKQLILESSQQVGVGVRLVGEAGNALEKIAARVSEIDALVGDIAASAQEQATGLDQVNTAVNQMDQVTQQNAAMVEESTAASHSLSHEAEEMMRLMSRFDVGGDVGANADVARKPATAHKTAPALVEQRKRVATFAAERGAAIDREGWREF